MLKKIRKIIDHINNRFFHYRKGNHLKVIITGPPRAGTSFLCGLVVRMGFDPGPEHWMKKGDQNNPYGYYECMPLMAIDHGLLRKMGGSVIDPPDLPENWIDLCNDEKKQIKKIVGNGGIEVYKGNMLVVIADLYAGLFPDAKWIMIHRGEEETIRSIQETGGGLSSQKLSDTRKRWLASWEKTCTSNNCLTIRYEDFQDDLRKLVENIAKYLGVSLSVGRLNECVEFFRPRSARSDLESS